MRKSCSIISDFKLFGSSQIAIYYVARVEQDMEAMAPISAPMLQIVAYDNTRATDTFQAWSFAFGSTVGSWVIPFVCFPMLCSRADFAAIHEKEKKKGRHYKNSHVNMIKFVHI